MSPNSHVVDGVQLMDPTHENDKTGTGPVLGGMVRL